MIQSKSIILAREAENKEQQGKTRDDVAAEVVERVVQKMAEGDNDEDATERDERIARPQTKDDKRAGDQLNERNSDADRPKRPDRQECVVERQKIFSGMLEWPQLKNFHHTGHEEDKAENETGKEDSPGTVCVRHSQNV